MVQILAKLFIPICHSSAIICLIYPLGIFTAYRLKVMTADQVLHTILMFPRTLGIINVTKQCFLYVMILKSSMFRQNFGRNTVTRQTPFPTVGTLTMQTEG